MHIFKSLKTFNRDTTSHGYITQKLRLYDKKAFKEAILSNWGLCDAINKSHQVLFGID